MAQVVIRADGSAEMGLGHVSRCLSLAEALVGRGVEVELVSGRLPSETLGWAVRSGVRLRSVTAPPGGTEDAVDTLSTAPDFVVVDGYRFDQGFFASLVGKGCLHMVIDDNGETAAIAPDMILNQNPSASPELYRRLKARTRLFLGLDHVLLRESIRKARRSDAHVHGAPYVLVALGGSDPCALTMPLAEELTAAGTPVKVAIGAATPLRATLRGDLELLGVDVVDPEDFEGMLASAGVAVIGAGSTMWEAAHLGVPAVAVVVASNQAAPAAAAEHLGFVRIVQGHAFEVPGRVAHIVGELRSDDVARSDMASLGPERVDGAGADRVAAAIGDMVAATT